MKVAFISGAGRGLGLATANAFFDAGFMVIASDINLKSSEGNSNKKGFHTIKADVTSESDLKKCAAFVSDLYGRLDVLVSNAGIVDFYPVSEAGSDRLRKILDVNLLGLANLTRYFLPLLSQSKGRLLVIGSESYKVPAPFQPYAVSKQALEVLYKSIKIELSLKGIRSVIIRPGAMQTHIMEETIAFENPIDDSAFARPFDRFKKTVPRFIGRISQPNEVAEIVLKAATARNPRSSYHVNHNPVISLLSMLPEKLKDYFVLKSLTSNK